DISTYTMGVLWRGRVDPDDLPYLPDEALLALRQMGPARLAEVRAVVPSGSRAISNWVGEGHPGCPLGPWTPSRSTSRPRAINWSRSGERQRVASRAHGSASAGPETSRPRTPRPSARSASSKD